MYHTDCEVPHCARERTRTSIQSKIPAAEYG